MQLQLQAPAHLHLRQHNLEVSLATTFAELDAALRLRFEVFNLELQEGLSASYERCYDRDAYDAWCDHLIVKDLTSGAIVGTYRLLRGSVATRNLGFYSENEFDLSALHRLPVKRSNWDARASPIRIAPSPRSICYGKPLRNTQHITASPICSVAPVCM
jgi:putative hemolysin